MSNREPAESRRLGRFRLAAGFGCRREAVSELPHRTADPARCKWGTDTKEDRMLRLSCLLAIGLCAAGWFFSATANAQHPDWDRFYHYPYIYYAQNYWGPDYYQSSNDLYHRYPPHMRIPVYNKGWYNFYPTDRKYHRGHHFIMDVF
jgi:hypothetical protein